MRDGLGAGQYVGLKPYTREDEGGIIRADELRGFFKSGDRCVFRYEAAPSARPEKAGWAWR